MMCECGQRDPGKKLRRKREVCVYVCRCIESKQSIQLMQSRSIKS